MFGTHTPNAIAVVVILLIVLLLYRRIAEVGKISIVFSAVSAVSVGKASPGPGAVDL